MLLEVRERQVKHGLAISSERLCKLKFAGLSVDIFNHIV